MDKVSKHPLMKGFVEEIGFCSFDTEGNGQLPRKFAKNGAKNQLFVAISSPKTGTVFLFQCALDINMELKKVLADYSIAKIQSGIGGDVALLSDLGIDV